MGRLIYRWSGSRYSSRVASFICSFVSAFIGMGYWHRRKPHKHTMDVTIVALVRAVDLLVHDLWRARRSLESKRALERGAVKWADTLVFVISCYVIMKSWFYYPERLPRYYQIWISRVASMDSRLLQALRYLQQGRLSYSTASQPLSGCLEDMAVDCGLSRDDGNLSKRRKIPCTLVHQGRLSSCEMHAFYRFRLGFLSAMFVRILSGLEMA
jgi:hypothetical protein